MRRYGEEVLESLVNKQLIVQHCRRHNIQVTQEEVDAEIARNAKKFNLGVEQWLSMLERERGILPDQYAWDIIWPTLALRKLARDQLAVGPQELQAAYETEFGEAVMARMIAVKNVELAQRLHAKVQANPDQFARLAREHSTDVASASAGGMLPPIRRHVGMPEIEEVVFRLQPGQVSPLVRVAEQHAMFLVERKIPPRKVPLEHVRERLEERIRDDKLRKAAHELFARLQKDAVVNNVLNDPVASRQMPGVAATINNQRITVQELAEGCLARHGEEVLEGEIHRLLLEQALEKRKTQVTQEDLDAEIAHAAVLSGVVKADGAPDLAKWREITEQQGNDYELYIHDVVWPSAALKKLVAQRVTIDEQDMQKGFEANYGPRVRCQAIIMGNLRRAQEVWDKARKNPTEQFFGKLAEQYSVETSSRSLQGEVPPIQKHGGQPVLEREAFKLQPGDISGVIQVGDRFVILRCIGYTEPIKVDLDEVRDLIHRDIYEKKLRMEMSKQFEEIRSAATIDNYLTGESQAPQAPAAARKLPGAIPLRVKSRR